MATALITGASGFIGGHLAQALVSRGQSVRCLVRRTSRVDHLPPRGVELVYADLAHPVDLEKAVAGVDVVYHLAAMTCALRRADLMRVNGHGTYHVARACASQATPPVHVYISSVAAGGTSRSGEQRNESQRAAPVSDYGRSKRAGELAAAMWARHVPTTIVRPGIVFGARDRELLPVFHGIAHLGLHFYPGFVPQPLSWIHVADLIEILLRAADRGSRLEACPDGRGCRAKGCYYACADEFPTYKELGDMISRGLGRSRVLPLPVPEAFLWVAAGANQLASLLRQTPNLFNLDKVREAMAGSWAASPQAVRDELNFTPPQTLAQRLRQTADWYRRHGEL